MAGTNNPGGATGVAAGALLEPAWRRSDALFDLLPADAWFEQPIRLRQPFLFYLGHLPAFAWNQLGRGLRRGPALDPDLDGLFARGIDPPDTRDPVVANAEQWPPLDEVRAYRDRARDALRNLVLDEDDPGADEIVHTVLEHEFMHHETLLYMLHQLAPGRKRRPAGLPPYLLQPGAAPRSIEIPGGLARLGAPRDGRFGWDNEFPELEIDVAGFTIDATAVRNAEFLEFVAAGGYARRELWADEAWEWRHQRGVSHPNFWRREGETWLYRTLFDELPLESVADWPASVSLAEARAYARWRGARLPTEAEVHRAAYATPGGALRALPWGDSTPGDIHGNFGFRSFSPTPVGSYPGGASAWGVHELVGNGWEWTDTPFLPHPGFRAMPHYAGYSQDFFDGRHFVLHGASWATDDRLVRRSFRNWFQPHYPYVFTKFRLVRPLPAPR